MKQKQNLKHKCLHSSGGGSGRQLRQQQQLRGIDGRWEWRVRHGGAEGGGARGGDGGLPGPGAFLGDAQGAGGRVGGLDVVEDNRSFC